MTRQVTHIPGRYEQTVRYYGWYLNKSRGMRKKANPDDAIPAVPNFIPDLLYDFSDSQIPVANWN